VSRSDGKDHLHGCSAGADFALVERALRQLARLGAFRPGDDLQLRAVDFLGHEHSVAQRAAVVRLHPGGELHRGALPDLQGAVIALQSNSGPFIGPSGVGELRLVAQWRRAGAGAATAAGTSTAA